MHARHAQAMTHAEPGQRLLERALRQTEIEQRGEEHVARDAGEDVEVQDARAIPGASRATPRDG
jgi:hypothetical protein